MGVSRRELYDVYAAVLLLEKYENVTDSKEGEMKKNDRQFGFMMRSGHSDEEIARAMEGLCVACGSSNAHTLARKLVELNNEGFIQISDEKPSDVYKELSRAFGKLNVSSKALSEALRRER